MFQFATLAARFAKTLLQLFFKCNPFYNEVISWFQEQLPRALWHFLTNSKWQHEILWTNLCQLVSSEQLQYLSTFSNSRAFDNRTVSSSKSYNFQIIHWILARILRSKRDLQWKNELHVTSGHICSHLPMMHIMQQWWTALWLSLSSWTLNRPLNTWITHYYDPESTVSSLICFCKSVAKYSVYL